jgi:glycosyltransferase involved in cell wall biosynthesis
MVDGSPTFSIITITKDNAVGLRVTLESITEQTNRDYELIVIDGHSKDGTVELVQEFDSIVDRFEQDSGEGIYAAMNQGVAAASGEWVIFMNAGDCFTGAEVLAGFAPRSDTDLAFGRARKTDGSPQIPYQGLVRIWENMPFSHQALFCRTEVLRARPFDLSFRIAGDFDFVMNSYRSGKRFESLDLEVAVADGDGISNTQFVRRVSECYRAARRYFFWNRQMHIFYLKKLRWARAMDSSCCRG